MVLSRKTCQARLPRTLSSCGKSSGTDFAGALCWCLCVSSPLISDVSTLCGLCHGPCFSLFSNSFISVNRKTYIAHRIPRLLNPIETKNSNYSSRETAIMLSPPRKRSDTIHHLMTIGMNYSGRWIGDELL